MIFFAVSIVALVIGWSSCTTTVKPDDPTTTVKPDEPTTTAAPEPTTTVASTTAKPFNDCPKGWVYAGKLGCLYFNTDKHKVEWQGVNWLTFKSALDFQMKDVEVLITYFIKNKSRYGSYSCKILPFIGWLELD